MEYKICDTMPNYIVWLLCIIFMNRKYSYGQLNNIKDWT